MRQRLNMGTIGEHSWIKPSPHTIVVWGEGRVTYLDHVKKDLHY